MSTEMEAVEAPKIGSVAPWFGSKRTLAPKIIQQLGPHKMYFEPFCGSMAVLIAKPRSRHETVNDLHSDAINLARVLAHPASAAALHRRLRRTLFHESLLQEARAVIMIPGPAEGDIERAFWFFIFSWMGRNGEAGLDPVERAGRACVRWTPNGGDPGTRWVNAVDSIPLFTDRLRPVVILNRDAMTEVIPKIADLDCTAIYVDPPYIEKSDRYLHDFSGNGGLFGDDHSALAKLLGEFEHARVVVSYYDHPRVRELYKGWTFIDCSSRKHLANQTARESKKVDAPELLIVNGPAY